MTGPRWLTAVVMVAIAVGIALAYLLFSAVAGGA